MFFAIRIGIATDDKTIQSSTACETLVEARKKYHSDLNGYIGNCKRITAMVVDIAGNVLFKENWQEIEE